MSQPDNSTHPVPPKGVPSMEDQKIALYGALAQLDKQGGHIATIKNAVALAHQISTVEQARDVLNLAETYLWKAYLRCRNYSLTDKILSGAADQNFNLLWANYESCQRIRARLPKDSNTISTKDAQATALTLLQTIENLRFTEKLVAESTGDSNSMADEFLEHMKRISAAMAKEIAEALANLGKSMLPSLWPVAAVVGGFFIVKSVITARASK